MNCVVWPPRRPSQTTVPFRKMVNGTLEETQLREWGELSKTQIAMIYSTTIRAFENISFEGTSKAQLVVIHCAEFFWTAGRSDTMGAAMNWALLKILRFFFMPALELSFSRKFCHVYFKMCLEEGRSLFAVMRKTPGMIICGCPI